VTLKEMKEWRVQVCPFSAWLGRRVRRRLQRYLCSVMENPKYRIRNTLPMRPPGRTSSWFEVR
jgi:hypothetical protein